MSRGKLRALRNQANAQHSTGAATPRPYPRDPEATRSCPGQGKQRSRMNAFKHNLSGNHLILQEHELKSYHDLTENMLRDLKPKTEPERQIALKIIDLNFRINRITSIENNMLNFDMMQATTSAPHDDRTEVMLAQTRAWKEDAKSFDLLGRYEGRLSKQLLQYQHELERMRTARKAEEREQKLREPAQSEPVNPDLASFGNHRPPLVMRASTQSANTLANKPPTPVSGMTSEATTPTNSDTCSL